MPLADPLTAVVGFAATQALLAPVLMPPLTRHDPQLPNRLLVGTWLALAVIEPALAQELAPLENVVDFLVDFLTGAFARSVAIIAVAVMGYLGLTGRLRWGVAGSIIVGIALIFGAATIVDAIAGSV